MNDAAKVSIIMPIYNAAKYLDMSIPSVLNQTSNKLELIIVNAASTDDTLQICEKYSKKDARVRVINLENRVGPGIARNIAMENAEGQYIMFMDGDDFIEEDMLEVLLKGMENNSSDLVVCGYYQDFINDNNEKEQTIEVIPPILQTNNIKETIKNIPILDVSKVLSFSWNKLYSKKIIDENNIRFPDMLHSEDYFFVISYMQYVKKMITIDKAFYHYLKRNISSLTNQAYHKDFLELMNNRFIVQVDLLKKYDVYEGEVKGIACAEHIKNIFLALENECAEESKQNGKLRREKIKKLLENHYVLDAIDNSTDITKVILLLNRIIRSKNAMIIDCFAKIIWFMRNKMARVYHKMKTK